MNPTRLLRAEVVALLAVGLFALAFQLWLPTTHVAERDYTAVAEVLRAEGQPGDVVLLAPWWTERARIFVPESMLVVGYQGSDADPLTPHPRIWVLSEPRQPRAGIGAFETAFLPQRTPVGPSRSFGNLELQLFTNGRHRPLTFDGAAALAQASVFIESADGQRQPCQANGRGFRCANGKNVVAQWRDVHFAPYQCVVMEAPGGSNAVVVEFNLPPTESLSLEAGYIWEYGSCKDGCTPSQVVLESGGEARAMELPLGDETMHRIEGGSLPQGGPVRVRFSSVNPSARVGCFVVRGTKGAP